MPPDFCVYVGFPTSWSRKMYLSCLLSLIEVGDSCIDCREDRHRFILHNSLNIGGKLYYTVGKVEKLFDISIPGLNLACKRSSEIVEKSSEDNAVARIYSGYEDCLQADLGNYKWKLLPDID